MEGEEGAKRSSRPGQATARDPGALETSAGVCVCGGGKGEYQREGGLRSQDT